MRSLTLERASPTRLDLASIVTRIGTHFGVRTGGGALI